MWSIPTKISTQRDIAELAAASIDEIHKRGAKVLVSGGTGLYLKALTGGLFSGPSQDTELRANLEREIAQIGLAALYDRLIAIDPGDNTKIHPNDRQRIIRALEVYQSTGRPIERVAESSTDFRRKRFRFSKSVWSARAPSCTI